jgi:hypothetical protein
LFILTGSFLNNGVTISVPTAAASSANVTAVLVS